MSEAFRALRHRTFRLYILGQFVSITGNWLQSTALAWFVFSLTRSTTWVGLVTFVSQLTAFGASPFAGVAADRFSRKQLLRISNLSNGVLTLALYAASREPATTPAAQTSLLAIILALAAGTGLFSSLEMTARHTFAMDLVGSDDLSSALSLNSMTINGARLVGPALAGLIIAGFGEPACFLGNALSFIFVFITLSFLPARLDHREQSQHQAVFAEISEGIREALKRAPLRKLLGLSTFISLIASPYATLLPVISAQRLHGDSSTLSLLGAAAGLGGILGILWFAQRTLKLSTVTEGGTIPRLPQLEGSLFGMAAGFMALALGAQLSSSALATLGCFAIGFFLMAAYPIINFLIQRLSPRAYRGRILSLYTMTFLGTVPIGSLVDGLASDAFGPVPVLIACAIVLLGAFFFSLRAGKRTA